MSKMQMIFRTLLTLLNPRMTVKEIISEGLKINGIRDKEFIDKEVNRALNWSVCCPITPTVTRTSLAAAKGKGLESPAR